MRSKTAPPGSFTGGAVVAMDRVTGFDKPEFPEPADPWPVPGPFVSVRTQFGFHSDRKSVV